MTGAVATVVKVYNASPWLAVVAGGAIAVVAAALSPAVIWLRHRAESTTESRQELQAHLLDLLTASVRLVQIAENSRQEIEDGNLSGYLAVQRTSYVDLERMSAARSALDVLYKSTGPASVPYAAGEVITAVLATLSAAKSGAKIDVDLKVRELFRAREKLLVAVRPDLPAKFGA